MAINYLNSIDLNQNELLHAQIENQASDVLAGTGVEGQLYFNTTDDVLKVWANGAWSSISGDITSVTAGDYLNGGGNIGDITINHDATSRSNTTSSDSPSYGGSFTVIDSVASNTYGHVTAVNTKTVTLPTSDDTTYDLTGAVSGGTNFAIALDGSDGTLDKVFLNSSTYITLTDGGSNDVTITHSDTTRTDTTSTDAPGYGGTFEAVQSVTTNAQGHVTAIDVSTVTIPATDNVTYTLPIVAAGSNSAVIELRAGGAGSGAAGAAQISGTTNEIQITETTGDFGDIKIGLPDDVTIAGELTVAGTGQSSFAGPVTIPQTPSADTDAASKHYVDQAVTGALSYQGGYNASTNTPNLDNNPSPNPIKTGWTYTVTADGLFFTEQVRVGDVLIAENDAPTTLAEWTTVQNNVDLADLTTVGIGNVNPGEAIDVSYSNGTATVSVEDSTATNKGAVIVAPGVGMSVAYSNGTATVTNTQTNSANTYAVTITDTATVTHNLGTKDVIIQLYDVTTDETVYADVERASINTAAIAFASTPTNSIRVLVQKIG